VHSHDAWGQGRNLFSPETQSIFFREEMTYFGAPFGLVKKFSSSPNGGTCSPSGLDSTCLGMVHQKEFHFHSDGIRLDQR